MPFGFTADELLAWVRHGGGQELWDSLSGQFNVKSLLCTSTGCQMGGWFTQEVTSTEQFGRLRYRMAGPGAEVLRRLGAIVVLLPPSDIMEALKSGAIDACEWVGPWLDMAMGLHKAAGYYYHPGFHEPGTGLAVGINKAVWDSFDAGEIRTFVLSEERFRFWMGVAIATSLVIGAVGTFLPLRIVIKAFQRMEF